MTRILVVQGHPDTREPHLCHKLAEAYVSGAEEGGHQVRRLELGGMDFPLLRSRAEWIGPNVPPAIARAQESVLWAEHLVILFPLWLGGMPALLKGFLEQLLRPGFAVRRGKGLEFEPLLKGRSAHIVVTMAMPALVYRFYFRAHALRLLRRNMLGFVGIRTVRETLVGSAERLSDQALDSRFASMRRRGRAAN